MRASEEVRSTAWKMDHLRKIILHKPVTNTHINGTTGEEVRSMLWELEKRESVTQCQNCS